MTKRGILQKKIILTGFDEKGNCYWSTASQENITLKPLQRFDLDAFQ